MRDTSHASHRLAETLPPGEHRLSDRRLRDLYGAHRITMRVREEIARTLTDSGLDVVSDPAAEPLIVVKRPAGGVAAAASAPRRRNGDASRTWYRRTWVVAAVTAFVMFSPLAAVLALPAEDDRMRPARAAVAPAPAALAQAEIGQPYRHVLHTHCGIHETRFAGAWWDAQPELDDGNGNPPAGWQNPTQPGTMELMRRRTALFRDDAGHEVRFQLREGATGPRRLCA